MKKKEVINKKKSQKEEKSKNRLVAKMSMIALSAYAIFKLKTETDILEKYFNSLASEIQKLFNLQRMKKIE